MKTCVIFNPVARGNKAVRFREKISQFARDCDIKPTTGPGMGRPIAADAVKAGYERIVAAGGDGTLNEVLNGIGDAGGFSRVCLGILPLGTVNVYAKELGLPSGLEAAWDVVNHGVPQSFCLAQADYEEQGKPVSRYFVQLAGAGLDSRAVELVDWEQKKKLGPIAYVLSGLRAMRENLPPITVTNGTETLQGQLVLVGNGRYYGGRFVLFPNTSLHEETLEVTVFPRVNFWTLLRSGLNVMLFRPPGAGIAPGFKGPRITMSCPARMPFQVEGENIGHLPATLKMVSGGVRLIVRGAANAGR